ncbi:type IV secretory system conjugative DNA transfer family protein [Listeria booriae]|uniref:VirD4-like conjugal transfer protein, CD1115 family n=1 Tax=Listeria booriae TaxID=1552123 RepID=UPI0016287687|nr:type IV secretory system conjugative DNA transfer family protein [Listeria booriae]MBC1287320.1 type IV secretory system conjugative DNA transfer family protein [Listeria booriae]
MTGTILGVLDKKVIVQPTESKPNRNVMVVGGPGSYKSQSYVITNVINETENSVVVTDPKGEIFEETAEIKRAQGYEVHVLNYSNMLASDRQNPIDYVRKDIHATTVATKIVDSANKDGKKDVWYYSQKALLKALILYAKYELHPDNRNLPGILDFLQEFDPEQGEDDDESELDKQFLILNRKHPARRAYELGYKKAKGDMQGSIIMSLLTTIADFVDEEVAEFTKCSDFHLRDIGRKKIALYVIIPAMDNSWEGLVNILFSQLFNELYDLAAENHAKLPVSVSFFLDEFVNLGKFPNYEEFLATCRGYGIGVSTIIQSITQLQDKYNDKKAESILGNCAVKICLNASNLTTANYFKDLLDKATVKIDTEGESTQHGKEATTSSTSENTSYSGRELMTAGEIMRMEEDESLVIFQTKRPIKAKKAFQFMIFPGLLDSKVFTTSQVEYRGQMSDSQKEMYREMIDEYEQYMQKSSGEKMANVAERKEQQVKKQVEQEEKEIADANSFFFVDSGPEEVVNDPEQEQLEALEVEPDFSEVEKDSPADFIFEEEEETVGV